MSLILKDILNEENDFLTLSTKRQPVLIKVDFNSLPSTLEKESSTFEYNSNEMIKGILYKIEVDGSPVFLRKNHDDTIDILE